MLNLGDGNSRQEPFQPEVAYVSPLIFQNQYQFDKYNTVINDFPISNFCSWLDEWRDKTLWTQKSSLIGKKKVSSEMPKTEARFHFNIQEVWLTCFNVFREQLTILSTPGQIFPNIHSQGAVLNHIYFF